MSKTDYQETANLNALTGLYAALFVGTNDPGTGLESAVTGSGWAEAAYSNYARLACALGTVTSGSGQSLKRGNTAELKFAAVAGSQITVRRVVWFDAITSGNPLYYSDTDLNTAVAVGVQPDFAIGALTISED